MRFLVRQRPWIDVPEVEMLALVTPGSGPGPRLHDKIVRLFEQLAVVRGIGVIEELLTAGAANPSGDQPPARDEIDLRQFLGHAQWMLDDGERVTNEQDFR